jgi:hypothetical protein
MKNVDENHSDRLAVHQGSLHLVPLRAAVGFRFQSQGAFAHVAFTGAAFAILDESWGIGDGRDAGDRGFAGRAILLRLGVGLRHKTEHERKQHQNGQ